MGKKLLLTPISKLVKGILVTVFLLVCLWFSSFGQIVFYCPFERAGGLTVSECNYYFDPYLNSRDSVTISTRDTFMGQQVFGKPKTITTNVVYALDSTCSGFYECRIGDSVFLKANLLNGLFNGDYRKNEAGKVVTANFINGKLDGEVIITLTGGSKLINNYKNGVLDGESKALYKEGNLTSYAFYKDGKLDGVKFNLHINGMLSSFFVFNNGEAVDGDYFFLNPEGQIIKKEKYLNGKKVETKWFDR